MLGLPPPPPFLLCRELLLDQDSDLLLIFAQVKANGVPEITIMRYIDYY
jgi:hypothetical protein